jgi:hypothetical protein
VRRGRPPRGLGCSGGRRVRHRPGLDHRPSSQLRPARRSGGDLTVIRGSWAAPHRRDISMRSHWARRGRSVTGDALNVVLAVATLVVSTAIAYVLYVRARREPRPVHVVTGNTVVQAYAERQIEVRYRDKDVPIVTRTVITFWNAGRQPIRRDDIVEYHPLTVVLPDGVQVLEARPIAATRPDIDFLVSWGAPTRMPDGTDRILTGLSFSFLNHRDGGSLEILHTGDDPFAATVEGAIVGVKGPPARVRSPLWDDPDSGLMLGLGLALSVLGLAYAVAERSLGYLFGVALGAAFAWFGYRDWSRDRRRVPAPLRGSLGPGAPPSAPPATAWGARR